jgi:hypothetical protein
MRDIHKANPKDIYQVAQYLFAPLDLTDFNKSLQESCKEYRVFMRQENFSKTRLDLYYLKGKFKERYEFLLDAAVETNNEKSLPSLSFKHGEIVAFTLFQTWCTLRHLDAIYAHTDERIIPRSSAKRKI